VGDAADGLARASPDQYAEAPNGTAQVVESS